MNDSNRNEINENIRKLDYDSEKVMVFNGTTVSNIDDEIIDNGNSSYTLITRKKVTFEGDFDIVVPESYKHITYPGALLQANDMLLDGKPTELAVNRGERVYTIDLPGLGSDGQFKTKAVSADEAYGEVTSGIQKAIDIWLQKKTNNGNSGWDNAAALSLTKSTVSDVHEMAIRFGLNAEYIKNKLNIDFTYKTENKKSIYLASYKQVFYTVSTSSPKYPAEVFADDTTWNDIKDRISDTHPPLLVGSVQYGRRIFIKFESNLTSSELAIIGDAMLSKDGIDINPKGEFRQKHKLDQVNVSVVVWGGGASHLIGANLSDLDGIKKINEVIMNNLVLDKNNPALPLSYASFFLKDGTPAKSHGITEYVEENVASYRNGKISIESQAWYVARAFINWEEKVLEKDPTSNKKEWKTYNKGWAKNGDNINHGDVYEFTLPANARNISIRVDYWNAGWNNRADIGQLALVPFRKVYIGGWTWERHFHIDPGE